MPSRPVWAFATVNRPDEKPFKVLARAVEQRVSEFSMQELANAAWAFAATVNRPDEKLFKAVARAVEQRVSVVNVQILANTAWAFAMVNRQDKKLFTALARTFATVNWLDEELFTALARAAEQQVSEFKPQELADTAKAFATGKRQDKKLFMRVRELKQQDPANTVMGICNCAPGG